MKPFIFIISLIFLSNTIIPSILMADEGKSSEEQSKDKRKPSKGDDNKESNKNKNDEHTKQKSKNDNILCKSLIP